MRKIKGIELNQLPFQIKWVGDLLRYDWPLISVFKDDENQIFIKSWVESNDNIHRYLIFCAYGEDLDGFINNKASYFQLLNNPINHSVFVTDFISNKISNCTLANISDLPYDYIPATDTMFDIDESKNLADIKNEIQLNRLDTLSRSMRDNGLFDIVEESAKVGSDLYNIHIKSKNKKVGFGVIQTSILGSLLKSFSDISAATALTMFDSRRSGDKTRRAKGEVAKVKSLGDTNFAYAKAASFSIFLKPIKPTIELFPELGSESKSIANQIFYVFEKSTKIEDLKTNKIELSDELLSAYTSFLKTVKENDINVSVQYGDWVDKQVLREAFDLKKAATILDNLDQLEIIENKETITKGTFRALDSISNTFKFESSNEEIFIGKFGESLYGSILNLNLKDLFEVAINTAFEKKRGKTGITEKHFITHYKVI
ncbi:hypothetical protein [Mucilaginibacter sp. BT774]|uniref:hypothetical protein n=1 Tax=Mucilaginibacter sp. BT774 TaxID=3062276 RepID=UPI0026751332|nr:hypothetical protein [Mucilaginibacter sp. BT774]MDO3627275.1 hypothetical protein [Mucilaginibacter sp. BT774]